MTLCFQPPHPCRTQERVKGKKEEQDEFRDTDPAQRWLSPSRACMVLSSLVASVTCWALSGGQRPSRPSLALTQCPMPICPTTQLAWNSPTANPGVRGQAQAWGEHSLHSN